MQAGPDMVHGEAPQTPRAQKSHRIFLEEARNLNHNYVGTNISWSALGLTRAGRASPPPGTHESRAQAEDVREEYLTCSDITWIR